MKKENILFGIIGLLVGLIVGFMFANSINQSSVIPVEASSQEMKANSNMPPGHPDISGVSNSAAVMQPEALAAIENAKKSPRDLDAQIKAAEAYYTVQKFDDAIALLMAANKLKPDEREIMVHLGNANFDGDHYEEAEKWYIAALAKQPDDVDVRTDLGLTYVFRDPPNIDKAIQEFERAIERDPKHIQALQNLTVAYIKKNDAAKANVVLAKLEAADPKNAAIARLREDLQKLN